MRREDFPIDPKAVDRFVAENCHQWGDNTEYLKKNEYVYVNLSMVRMQAAWIIPKMIYARGVADTLGAGVIVVTWRDHPLLDEICNSFGFRHYCIEKEDRKNFPALWKAFKAVSWFMLTDGSGEGLKEVRFKNFMVGRAIYEDILRTSELSTIRSARNPLCIRKFLHILWMFHSLKSYCEKNHPIFAVSDDVAYHGAIISSLFHSYDVEVIYSNQAEEMALGFDDNGNPNRIHITMQRYYQKMISEVGREEIEYAEELLSERFQGKNGRDIDRGAFRDKRVMTREEAVDELYLDPKKKNVVIMAHTFTDAVYNYGDLFYRDYYDWTEQTLLLAEKNNKVNWILKPHPTRKAYHESKDSIEDMFARHKKSHMTMLSDEISTESIKDIADIIVTIGSNAGGEFACFGIPSVIIGTPYYGGMGFTIEPKTREEYENCLMHIDEIKPLNETQITIAKKAFYLRCTKGPSVAGTKYDDEFADMINRKYKAMSDKMALSYFESNRGTKQYNTEILESITEYIKNHNVRECKYYTQGKMRAKT